MKKQTVVDQIEINREGHIQVRLAKEVVDDDGTVLTSDYHRTVLPPGHDIDAQMAAVNNHLTVGLKFPAVEKAHIDKIKTHATAAWTPAVVAAHKAKVAAHEKMMADKEAQRKADDAAAIAKAEAEEAAKAAKK